MHLQPSRLKRTRICFSMLFRLVLINSRLASLRASGKELGGCREIISVLYGVASSGISRETGLSFIFQMNNDKRGKGILSAIGYDVAGRHFRSASMLLRRAGR